MNQKKSSKKRPNKFLALSGAGLEMGLTIYLGNLLGSYLDTLFQTGFLEETLTVLAVFFAMYLLIKKVNKIND